ncbi:hypothetical protein SLS53_008739 [Cytospora paraplurivora]|uniref:HNH nuclease domain-containing protein n=1 Tax=Cytospora paraplurivora TaxID=2898453 RepID=A0AAN9U6J8_9PEZI
MALAPSLQGPPVAADMSRRCCVTGYKMGLNDCHLVPKNQAVWWANNEMRRYTNSIAGELGDVANLALLRADIHNLLDNHHFGIVPKPSSSSSSSSTNDQDSDGNSFAFAVHVLKDDATSRELCALYQNVAIAQAGVDRARPEFLLARFAWAIFSHLQTFLYSPVRRHLAVIIRDENQPSITQIKLMDGREVTGVLASRGLTRSGSRKRSSSQITQDEGNLESEDLYQERWERRSRQFSSGTTSWEDMDPEMRQIQENTRWYDEVGQLSSARDFELEQIEQNDRWYAREIEHQHADAEDKDRWDADADDFDEALNLSS